jgi:hypothetical protein
MERFVETSGTYKLVTAIEFEQFAQALGNYILLQIGYIRFHGGQEGDYVLQIEPRRSLVFHFLRAVRPKLRLT